LTRVAVIVHERLGNWARQLRPRLYRHAIRWCETRSAADLDAVLTGLISPVVLFDLAQQVAPGLRDLNLLLRRAPDARALVLDPEAHDGVSVVARELGATYVLAGFAPPPLVADLLARWIVLARSRIEREGWSRVLTADPGTEPWSWLSEYLDDRKRPPAMRARPSPGEADTHAAARRAPMLGESLTNDQNRHAALV
jgi:hypothetical protein